MSTDNDSPGASTLYVRGLSPETRQFIKDQAKAQNYGSEAAYVREVLDSTRRMFERAQAYAARKAQHDQ